MACPRWLRRRWLLAVLFSLPLIFFAVFYFYPLGAVFRVGLFPEGLVDPRSFVGLLATPEFLRVLWFTFWQAAVSTVLTLLLAMPGAYMMARYRFRGKSAVRALATLPFVLPTVVVAAAFTALIGPRGIANLWLQDLMNLDSSPIQLSQTIWVILLAHIFYNYSVALWLISAYWQNMGQRLGEAAQTLGASPWQTFWHITLPALRPAITAAAVLIFIFSFTSFGVIVILGGPGFATIEVEIYRQALNLFNIPLAAALSLWQIIFTFILMWFYTRTQRNIARPASIMSRQSVQREVKTGRDRLIVYGNSAFIILLIGTPIAALIARSVRGQDGPTLGFYRALFIDRQGSLFFVAPAEAIVNSLSIALAAMVIALSLGLIGAQILTRGESLESSGSRRQSAKWAGLLDPVFMLPLATSAVTLGLGYIIALGRPPINLRSSVMLLPIAHALVAIPFVLRSVLPAMRRIDPSLREAASTLGAGPWRTWRSVDWPLLQGALLVGAVFAFTISMGEFGATVFISRPQTPTMPVAIFRFLGQPGSLNYGQALAMSCLLMLVCATGFLVMEHFREVGSEGF